MAGEDAIIPSTVTGRDNINNVRPQNFVVGATKTIRPSLLNETRVAFNRFRQVNGLPELDFNVNGQTTHLPQFVVCRAIRPWAAPAVSPVWSAAASCRFATTPTRAMTTCSGSTAGIP